MTIQIGYRKDAGFSLIEAALALAIIGVIAGLTLPALLNMLHLGKIKTTHAHQEAVMTALAAYALREGKLPFPSDSAHPGLSCENLGSSQGSTGGIPYITLGIPEKYAKDGFNRLMVYVIPKVDHEGTTLRSSMEDRTNSSMNNQNFNYGENTAKICTHNKLYHSHITIVNEHKTPLFDTNKQPVIGSSRWNDFIAVVLISYGEDYSLNGEGIGEQLNRDHSFTFMDRPYSTQPKNPHRHILKWASLDFLMMHYGQVSCPAVRYHQLKERDLQPDQGAWENSKTDSLY